MAKPTKKQQEILDLMANGWELGKDMGLNSFAWIQEGGLGKGGKSLSVSIATVHSLWKKDLIRIKSRQFPTTHYELT